MIEENETYSHSHKYTYTNWLYLRGARANTAHYKLLYNSTLLRNYEIIESETLHATIFGRLPHKPTIPLFFTIVCILFSF